MKSRNWFWGLFFIVAAALVIVNQLGYLTGVNLFSLVCTIFLVPIIIKSAMGLHFGGILFPLAILGILYAEPLGITNLVPWPILAAALFGTIGLSLIFHRSWNQNWKCTNGQCDKEHFDQIINDPDSNVVECRVKFGSSVKYVNTDDLKKGYFDCSFGAMKVYFDKASIKDDNAEIYLDVSFAGMELYVPKEWRIINDTNCSLGAIEEKNARIINKETEKTVRLAGRISFAGVEIIYI